MREVIESESAFTLDYAQVIDEDDFTEATESTLRPRAIISGWLNGIRLIDNMAMRAQI
jgi:pantoate--beta-alanine ligase